MLHYDHDGGSSGLDPINPFGLPPGRITIIPVNREARIKGQRIGQFLYADYFSVSAVIKLDPQYGVDKPVNVSFPVDFLTKLEASVAHFRVLQN